MQFQDAVREIQAVVALGLTKLPVSAGKQQTPLDLTFRIFPWIEEQAVIHFKSGRSKSSSAEDALLALPISSTSSHVHFPLKIAPSMYARCEVRPSAIPFRTISNLNEAVLLDSVHFNKAVLQGSV